MIYQVITAFCFGLLLSPWSWGPALFFGFLLLRESIWCLLCGLSLLNRLDVILASVLGWVLGRYISGLKPWSEEKYCWRTGRKLNVKPPKN